MEPLFSWELWIGQFFIAVSPREHSNASFLLSDPVEVFDDPLPRPERKGEAENPTVEANRIARDLAEISKTNEINDERRNKRPKFGPNVFLRVGPKNQIALILLAGITR